MQINLTVRLLKPISLNIKNENLNWKLDQNNNKLHVPTLLCYNYSVLHCITLINSAWQPIQHMVCCDWQLLTLSSLFLPNISYRPLNMKINIHALKSPLMCSLPNVLVLYIHMKWLPFLLIKTLFEEEWCHFSYNQP